jgi:hypothetical protein
LAKVAVKCSADPEVSGWLIKVWFFASIFVVKIATFAKRQTVVGNAYTRKILVFFKKNSIIFCNKFGLLVLTEQIIKI